MLPPFDENGNLPPGEHECQWDEFVSRFGNSETRREILDGLWRALRAFKRAGCQRILVGGSFVTAKTNPGDFDAIWERQGVQEARLDAIFRDIEDMRYGARMQKAIYLGEIHPYHEAFVQRFSRDRAGFPKGLVVLNPQRIPE